MSARISVIVLLCLIASIGLLFFQVIRPFVVAIFVAIVLAVLFTPAHRWLSNRLHGHSRIAAAITTAFVLLLVLLPIGSTLLMAGTQVMEVGKEVLVWFDERSSDDFEETLEKIQQTRVGNVLQDAYLTLPIGQRENVKDSAKRLVEGATSTLYEQTRGMVVNLFTFTVNASIITLALYYFLADRDSFVNEVHRLLPLTEGEEERLTDQFERVCRGVVFGTVVAGVIQAGLSGIAYAILGVPNVWMLIVLTLLLSFIPFLGSASVWGVVSILLLIDGRYGAGIFLAVYGTVIVSTSDNLVRSYVIGNQAQIHPLIALVTVIGALQFIGLWGIFIGPMIAALLYSLIDITRVRMAKL